MERLSSADAIENSNFIVRSKDRFTTWLAFEVWYRGLGFVEFLADRYAKWIKLKSYVAGLLHGGFREASARQAGLL